MVEETPTQEVVKQEENSIPNIDEVAKQLEQLKATNDRLLAESKDWKAKAQGLRLETENREKKELEDKESWKELLEKERDEKHRIAEANKNLKRDVLKKQLNFEVSRYASDAHNLDDLLGALPVDALQIDEENLSITGVKEIIDNMRKEKSYMFKQAEIPSMVNKKPGMMPTTKTVGEMNRAEKKDALGDALARAFGAK